MARKTKEETEKTYHALLDAASRLFIRQGVARTTLKDVAEEAGMTRGAVYWHFDDKDAVIKALWQRNAEASHDQLIEDLQQIEGDNPAQAFRSIIHDIIQTVVNDQELAQVLRIVILNVEFTVEGSDLQQFLMQRKSILFSAMVSAFEQLRKFHALKVDLPTDLLAFSLISYMHGLIELYLRPGQQTIDLALDSEALLDLLLDSMLIE